MGFFKPSIVAATALGLLTGAPAWPQEGADELEEVVVSARKRDERLQDIPLSISAFSEEKLSQAGILNLEDVARRTVGLNFNQRLAGTVPGRAGSALRFRGISIEGTGASLPNQATASVFIDGVYVFSGAESFSFEDIARVEVIKGPQSAFFGRNTFSGAVNYITRDPDLTDHHLKLDVSGAEREEYNLSLSANGPLLDNKLGYQISGRYYSRGAQYTATDGGGLGEERSAAISGTLLFKPTEQLTFKLRAAFQRDTDGPAASAYLPGSTPYGYPAGFGAFPVFPNANPSCAGVTVMGVGNDGAPGTFAPRNYVCGTVPDPGSPGAPRVTANTVSAGAVLGPASTLIDSTFFQRTAIPGVPELDDFGMSSKILRSSLQANYQFGNGYELAASAAYNSLARNWVRDFDLTDTDNFYSTDPQQGEDRSYELRLTSPAEGRRLRWLVGLNYAKQDFKTSNVGGTVVITCAFAIPGLPCIVVPGGLTVALPPDAGDIAKVSNYYGALSFDITEQLTLDLEGSYLDDKRTQSGFDISYKKFVPRGILSWKPNGGTTLYGSYSIGALPGAVNARIITAGTNNFTTPYIDPRTGQPSTASERAQFQAALGPNFGEATPTQELKASEIGWKQQFLDGRLSVAVAAYDYKWENRLSQQFVTVFFDSPNIVGPPQDGVPNATANVLNVNVQGGAEARGFEFESSWRVNSAVELGFNMAFNKNEITAQFNPFVQQYLKDVSDTSAGCVSGADVVRNCRGTGNVAGTTGGRYPEIQGSLFGSYESQTAGGNNWYLRGDVLYTGETEADAYEIAKISDYFVVNARLGWEVGRMNFEIFARNLLDEKKWAAGQQFADFTRMDGFRFDRHGVQLIPLQRRTAGVRFIYKF